MKYDLHVHTQGSDGSTPVEEVVSFAAAAGLDGIVISDHDTMAMVPRAVAAAKPLGLDIVPGMELSTVDAETGRKVHLLVYYPQDTAPLKPIFREMAELRGAAGEQMLQKVAQRYPITRERVLKIAQNSTSIFRVHIMRALLEMGYASEVYGPLYRELLSDPFGSCAVPVRYTDMLRAARAARESGGVVVLAHPCVYDSFDAARRLGETGLIDGLELDYPRRKDERLSDHHALIERFGLIPTGGTDYHGFYSPSPHPIATCVTGEYAMERLHTLKEKRTRH